MKTLYEITGSITDINTLLVNKAEYDDLLGAALAASSEAAEVNRLNALLAEQKLIILDHEMADYKGEVAELKAKLEQALESEAIYKQLCEEAKPFAEENTRLRAEIEVQKKAADSKWIPVSETLPSCTKDGHLCRTSQQVLVRYFGDHVGTAYLLDRLDGDGPIWTGHKGSHNSVTDWMEIPQ
ncbi:MAG: hypothetical protein KAX57_06940 [Rhodoferax sp.]|jgi:type I site-specific restriction-modification system R (restriction) subunit|uniref:hypothetical protein n=1 Tax=Rhodoferax sp. TaxID=50421 RepID=UPI001B755852|nr:hypothetical protein [Rhodoferax sp.]MBP8286560.1 hypothetical protein [Rhodoferax sp.]MBP9149206.1 hypothetical protein [Rhodoferax sp.]MBP9736157.1 hypothetical protein [Rhodoferax sp.]